MNGVTLPESHNGLGPRNLIYILLKLFECFKDFMTRQPASGVHLVFIEEPEAHLHPQMQTVFVRKLAELRGVFAERYNKGEPWPVQFVVTTHSSHIANEASFDSMRYFLTRPAGSGPGVPKTDIKDLRVGLGDEEPKNREFLHKYMTLTRCDLLFADRAILIEGPSERLLLPVMITKSDEAIGNRDSQLGSQYLSVVEVGGAHAHRFFNLLDFLDLRALIITDLDSVKMKRGRDKNKKTTKTWVKCLVSEGMRSSNSCMNQWFQGSSRSKWKSCKDFLEMKAEDKTRGNRRLAYQVPQESGDACGRSFEEAFILANGTKFGIAGTTPSERELEACDAAPPSEEKTDFALEYAISDTDWITPRYIEEGLRWLGQAPVAPRDAEDREEKEASDG